jgi:putative membrane protein
MRTLTILFAGLLLVPAAGLLAGQMTDAQIASIVVTANQVDVDAGALVASKTNNAEVKSFAELMVTDHNAVNRAATELVTKLKVTPEDNPTSQSLKAGGEKNIAALKALDGAALDKAYVDHEVAYHQQVVEALDKLLIPGATNEELKGLLVKVRPAFVAHLDHAKALQAAMARSQS